MRKFLLGFIAAPVLLFVVGLIYIKLGLAPVAASSAPLPFEKTITRAALHARLKRERTKACPIAVSDQVYLAGAQVYRNNCAVCHGLPGQEELPPIGKGEFPKPPALFRGKGVTDDPVGVTYWQVANGVRLSGMPAFKGSLSTDQMWQVSLLLLHADQLPAEVETVLQKPLPAME